MGIKKIKMTYKILLCLKGIQYLRKLGNITIKFNLLN